MRAYENKEKTIYGHIVAHKFYKTVSQVLMLVDKLSYKLVQTGTKHNGENKCLITYWLP